MNPEDLRPMHVVCSKCRYPMLHVPGQTSASCPICGLLATLAELRRQLTVQSANNHERNVLLAGLHWVSCSGGCPNGVHYYDGKGPEAITQEVVDAAVRNTERLETWWANRQARGGGEPGAT